MLRNMIHQVFGARTFSRYDDRNDVGLSDEICERTGHQFLGTDFKQFYAERKDAPEHNFVKTHHPPQDDSPAIYVIRDGRSAIVSYYNLLTRLRKHTDVTIADIICGNKYGIPFGNWSAHIGSWNPRNRPKTLLLRYSDLHANPDRVLSEISSFLNIPQTGAWQNNFGELQTLLPEFFHHGSDDRNLSQMTDEDLELFRSIHAQCMRDYGFSFD